MYSYTDFENFFLRYKTEAVPSGISIQSFCNSEKVPYNLFEKWYKDTRKAIVPVQVLDAPGENLEAKDFNTQGVKPSPKALSEFRICVDIRMSNDVHVSQKNLSYSGLKTLIEKLEVLC